MDVLHETRVVQLNKMIGLPTTDRPSNKEVICIYLCTEEAHSGFYII